MKKVIALLLCALLIGVTAVAEEAQETALVTFVSDIELESGSAAPIHMDGFEAYLSIDTADGLALVAQAFDGDTSLALAVAKLVGSQLQIGIDGLDTAYAVDIQALAGQDTYALGELFRPVLPELLDIQLPMIDVPDLPKLDLTTLVGMVNSSVSEDGTISFTVPHEMIDSLMDQVIEVGNAYAQNIQGAGEALELVEQLRASGTSVALRGTITDVGEMQLARAAIYPVSGGQTAESAVAIVNMTSTQGALSLTVNATEEGEAELAKLEIQTDEAQDALSASLNIADAARFDLGAYREDGLQKVALTVGGGLGVSSAVTMKYGKNGDNDVMDLTLVFGDDFGLEIISDTAPTSDVANAGTLELIASVQGNRFRLNANVEMFLGSLDLGGYTLPENAMPLDELSDDQNGEALQTALQPLIEYFGRAFMNAAA